LTEGDLISTFAYILTTTFITLLKTLSKKVGAATKNLSTDGEKVVGPFV